MSHEELDNLAPLYALGALDGEDLARFQAHLSGCPECLRRVSECEEASAGMALALPPERPPLELRDRILVGVRANPPGRRSWPAVAAALAAAVLGVLWYQATRELRELKDLLGDPRAQVVLLKGTPEAPAASGRVVWKDRRVLFFGAGLPQLPEKRVYELWAIVGERPIKAGLYGVDAQGNSTGTFTLPQAIARVDVFAITLEPEGGLDAPSGKMYLVPR